MEHVGIVGGLRSYIGVEGGMYRKVSVEQLGAHVLRQIPEHCQVPVEDIDMVIAGNGVGGGGNLARLALLEAGYPEKVAGITIDVQCGSGLEAIAVAAAKIEAGLADVIVAGGMESASTRPQRVRNERHPDYTAEHPEYSVAKFSPGEPDELAMFRGAERVCERLSADKDCLNADAVRSHQRAARAAEQGLLEPILASPYRLSTHSVAEQSAAKKAVGQYDACDRDEGIHPRLSERLLQRLPMLVPGGQYVTAGTVSLMNDGAAFVVLCSREYAKHHAVSWKARIVDVVSVGADPDYSPESMIPAISKLLERNVLTADQITAWEYNEAFAVMDELMRRNFGDRSGYNIYGGALAYGHPYGASGAIITLHLLQALRQLDAVECGRISAEQKHVYGVAAVSAAGGMGTAMLIDDNKNSTDKKNVIDDRRQKNTNTTKEPIDDYWKMINSQPSSKVMLIEDEVVLTYGQMAERALHMRNTWQEEREKDGEIRDPATLTFIQEDTIADTLIAFFACQGTGLVPVILSEDVSEEERLMLQQTKVPEQAVMGVLTSGTTGRKKILFRTFASWADFFPVQNEVFAMDADTILFAEGSLAFTGNLNLYLALFSAGGTVVATQRFQPQYWLQLILEHAVNAIYLIPAKMMALCRVVREPIRGIRHLTTGSQAFGQRELTKVKCAFPNMHVVLYYGSSEVSYITYLREEDMTDEESLVGVPFPNVQVMIRDGAFYVANACGVLGVDMPCNTGDLGRVDEQGRFYFLGREDDILNVNGRKVSAYRIEQTFAHVYHVTGIAEVANKGEHQELVFCYEGEKELPQMSDVRRRLRGILASYEIPKKCRKVDVLPRTESGKVSRHRM